MSTSPTIGVKPYPKELNQAELFNHQKQISEYAAGIQLYNYNRSQQFRANLELVKQQPEISLGFRRKLIEFLFKISLKLKITPFVTYKAVRLFDRYASKRIVLSDQSQLVICTCLWLATKTTGGHHQSSYAPHTSIPLRTKMELPTRDLNFRLPKLAEFVKLCGKACNYDEGMFVQMEWHILQTLDWEVQDPNVDDFLLSLGDNQHLILDDTQYETYKVKEFLSYITLFIPEMVEVSTFHVAMVIKETVNELLGLSYFNPNYQSTSFACVTQWDDAPAADVYMAEALLSASPSFSVPSPSVSARSPISVTSLFGDSRYSPSVSSASSYEEDFSFEGKPASYTRQTHLDDGEPFGYRLSFEQRQKLKTQLIYGVLLNFEFFYLAGVFTSQLKGIKQIIQRCYEVKLMLAEPVPLYGSTPRNASPIRTAATGQMPPVPFLGSRPPLPGFMKGLSGPSTPVASYCHPRTPEFSMPLPSHLHRRTYATKLFRNTMAGG